MCSMIFFIAIQICKIAANIYSISTAIKNIVLFVLK